MDWETTYKQSETVWGFTADKELMGLAPSVPKGKVLDLGMGEGRNILPFALQGYEAIGVDSAPTAVQKALDTAKSMNVSLDARVGDIREARIEAAAYSLILSTMTLQFMKYAESKTILEKIMAGLQRGGYVFLTVFSIEDPMRERLMQKQEEVEPNTFFHEGLNSYVHFFQKDDLLKALAPLKLQRFSQTIHLDAPHPPIPVEHYHGTLTYIGQKV